MIAVLGILVGVAAAQACPLRNVSLAPSTTTFARRSSLATKPGLMDRAQAMAAIRQSLAKEERLLRLQKHRNEWYAIKAALESDGTPTHPHLLTFRIEPGTRSLRKEQDIIVGTTDGDWSEFYDVGMQFMPLGANSGEALVVHSRFFAADCSPEECAVFRVGRRLRRVQNFFGLAGTEVLSSARRRLTIVSGVKFKVWWPDVYEWNGKRFVLANRRHPEVYKREHLLDKDDFGRRLRYACVCLIRGQRGRALRQLEQAERCCKLFIREQRGEPDAFDLPHTDFGFYGEPYAYLAEIRKREEWLKRRQFNHALLYRPIDNFLQVPPYRLGSATADPLR